MTLVCQWFSAQGRGTMSDAPMQEGGSLISRQLKMKAMMKTSLISGSTCVTAFCLLLLLTLTSLYCSVWKTWIMIIFQAIQPPIHPSINFFLHI